MAREVRIAAVAALGLSVAAIGVWSAALAAEASGELHRAPRVASFALVPDEPPAPAIAPATLTLVRLATNERVEVAPFDGAGQPQAGAFETLTHLFAAPAPPGAASAAAASHEVAIDPRLADLLVRISQKLGEPLILVSGHREPGRGTSRGSYHVKGQAADIAVRGVGVQQLRKVALELGAGGVGLYPDFVHVDVREEPYRWVGGRWRKR